MKYKVGDKVLVSLWDSSLRKEVIETIILQQRLAEKKIQYLVKWNYGHKLNSIESAWWVQEEKGTLNESSSKAGFIIRKIENEEISNSKKKDIYSKKEDGMTGGPSGLKWL